MRRTADIDIGDGGRRIGAVELEQHLGIGVVAVLVGAVGDVVDFAVGAGQHLGGGIAHIGRQRLDLGRAHANGMLGKARPDRKLTRGRQPVLQYARFVGLKRGDVVAQVEPAIGRRHGLGRALLEGLGAVFEFLALAARCEETH
jgi:hypothetical protein